MPLWRANDFMLAMSFPSAVRYEVAFLMMPRIEKEKKPFSFSACHSPAQMIWLFFFPFEREMRCSLFLNIAF